MAAFIIYEPHRATRVFILRRAESLIGSGGLNDERLFSKGVETLHLSVVERVDGWWVLDKTGKGLLVNGAKISEALLKDGDEIRAGEARLKFDAAYTHDGEAKEPPRKAFGGTDILTKSGRRGGPDMVGMLIFRGGERRDVDLTCDPFHIGAAEDNSLPLPLKYVSQRHCRLFTRDRQWWITDVGSTNHTYVDESEIGEIALRDCAVLRFGKPEAVFRLRPAGKGRVHVPVFEGMVGNSAGMLDVYEAIRTHARNNSPVLITGETGTGKELVARAMHKQSGRPAGAYVTLNCANVPKDLAESELFGHEKGAFTGAHAERAGVFEAADGGTLFLDEIGEMPLELQAKVLRAIEYHEVKKVGGNKVKLVTTRIVAATNRDLAAMVEAGTFREDLFYRLKVVTIALPALKDRIEDVPALADYMLDEMSEGSVVLADKAKAKLCDYEWPGNVRELHNVIAVAMYNCKHGVVDAGDIKLKPARLQERVEHGRAVYVGKTMEEIEIEVIEDAVRRHKGDKQAAAKELRIGFSTLKAKLREREIAEANARGPS